MWRRGGPVGNVQGACQRAQTVLGCCWEQDRSEFQGSQPGVGLAQPVAVQKGPIKRRAVGYQREALDHSGYGLSDLQQHRRLVYLFLSDARQFGDAGGHSPAGVHQAGPRVQDLVASKSDNADLHDRVALMVEAGCLQVDAGVGKLHHPTPTVARNKGARIIPWPHTDAKRVRLGERLALWRLFDTRTAHLLNSWINDIMFCGRASSSVGQSARFTSVRS